VPVSRFLLLLKFSVAWEESASKSATNHSAAVTNHFMKKRKLLILFFSVLISNSLKAQNLQGIWKETNWGPMTSYYYFDTLTSTFKDYYRDDTHGSFGKGKFNFKKNIIEFEYDSIICDKPILELLDDDLPSDTSHIALFQYWGFPKRIDILENNRKIYSSWTKSDSTIIEDHLFVKIPKRLDSLEIVIYDFNGFNDKEIERFFVRLHRKPYCNLWYYPPRSWYSYDKKRKVEIKIEWKRDDLFEIKRGKNRWVFQKEK
jgi:hypothetical protein